MSSSERTGNKYRISPELFSRDLEREREFGMTFGSMDMKRKRE